MTINGGAHIEKGVDWVVAEAKCLHATEEGYILVFAQLWKVAYLDFRATVEGCVPIIHYRSDVSARCLPFAGC